MTRPIRVGAVMYDPKVSVIWEIIRDFFETQACPIDVEFYSTYSLQVAGLMAGDLDIAWNSPLAWLDTVRRSGGQCRALAMRDSDRDRTSHLIARRDRGFEDLRSLSRQTVAFGAADSPQATLIPMGLLRRAGLEPGRDYRALTFNVLVGKHGDHIGGELDAFRALERGDADASALLDLNWQAWTRDGTIDAAKYHIVASSERFDHCVFTVRAEFPDAEERRWLRALYAMSYENPAHRQMMDLEGLKAWLPGRTSGFTPLREAVAAFRFFDTQEAG